MLRRREVQYGTLAERLRPPFRQNAGFFTILSHNAPQRAASYEPDGAAANLRRFCNSRFLEWWAVLISGNVERR